MATENEIIRATHFYNHPAGSVAQLVFTYQLQGGDAADSEILTDYAQWVFSQWVPDWEDLADTLSVLDYIELDVLNADGTVKRNIGPNDFDNAGTIVGEIASAGVAAFIQSDTERTKSLARKYIPGLSESVIDDGVLNATALAQMALLLLDLKDVIAITASADLVPGVLSRVTLGFLELGPGGYISDIPAYQRRRKLNVGS